MYKRGIQVLESDLQTLRLAGKEDEQKSVTRHIASAWASIADLHMTHLCDEPNA